MISDFNMFQKKIENLKLAEIYLYHNKNYYSLLTLLFDRVDNTCNGYSNLAADCKTTKKTDVGQNKYEP